MRNETCKTNRKNYWTVITRYRTFNITETLDGDDTDILYLRKHTHMPQTLYDCRNMPRHATAGPVFPGHRWSLLMKMVIRWILCGPCLSRCHHLCNVHTALAAALATKR